MKKVQLVIHDAESPVRNLMEQLGVEAKPWVAPGQPDLPLLIEASSSAEVQSLFARTAAPAHGLIAVCPDSTHLPPGCLWLCDTMLADGRCAGLLQAWLGETESDQAQGLLAQISHDMRSPLSVISTAASLARKFGKKDAKLGRYLSLIEESSGVLKSLVNDILDFSKIREGQLAFVTSDFNLRQLAHSMVDSFGLLVKTPKHVSVECRVDEAVPEFVHGDPGRLRQVLTNLMSNAMKFTELGSVTLRLSCEAGSERVRFEVADTGVGIKPEALQRIFLPYQQADDHVQKSFGGTGLGLTICRLLVQKMGGEIGVESTFGEGSTFFFTAQLPRVVKERAGALPELKGGRILVATNNPSVIPARVGKENEIFVCPTDKEVGRVIRDCDFDLYIIDMAVDGFELPRRILLQKPGARVVVTTSAGQRGDFAVCRELGLCGYLTIPMSEAEFELALALASERNEVITRYSAKELLAQHQPSIPQKRP